MDPILEIATRRGLAVIEDAAHSLPARYKGEMDRDAVPVDRVQLLRHQEL